MQLKPFQLAASTQMAERFLQHQKEQPLYRKGRLIPFYQNLISLTGSGKTLILADAIAQMRHSQQVEPVVLWLSKANAVVWQTYANLADGPYAELLDGFRVLPLHECRPRDFERAEEALLLVATVGKFNQKDKENGDRRIFQIELDKADLSLWSQLKSRLDTLGRRRPFWIVYDESHNLSNQQMELLLELEPEALLLASATMRVPEAMLRDVNRLREEREWSDADWITTVNTTQVVASGLIKQHVNFSGYVSPMEEAIDEMLEEMHRLERAAQELELPFLPKSIYVSHTNIVHQSEQDDIRVDFDRRLARPILIWRYLVEQKGVDPSEIAVYCHLKFDAKYPPPKHFVLFNGGESDFESFRSGSYRHIIFNLTLQEGWDDPECYLAYIDKGMASKDQITQVIGRVLRQPGAKHYAAQELNTAHFYVRTDEKSALREVLQDVQAKLMNEMPDMTLSVVQGGRNKPKLFQPPRFQHELPQMSVLAPGAQASIRHLIDRVHDYRHDEYNTIGNGERLQVRQTIGQHEPLVEEWVQTSKSNKVTARRVFLREIQKQYGAVETLCDTHHPKFSAMVGYNSRAADTLREDAGKVVQAYLDHAQVVQNNLVRTPVGTLMAYGADLMSFRHSVHEKYGGLNELEKKIAQAIDDTGYHWLRNPPRGLFEIPLLDRGPTKHFNPDFLVWTEQLLVAIDTKGDHLIREDAGRKLFHVQTYGPGPQLQIRLVTEGKSRVDFSKESHQGYTVWTLKNGRPFPIHADTPQEAVQICLQSLDREALL